ncbi:probable bifunctional dTTP/UTP pyrophosphatase/methyltransferase protein isoform X2 [Anabrus simplex]|uniref:probable bifunctional dTTP/UTP pyrophosphatase/methyltransferase protein isoform X2 n=1 Tax=Anabrus simplex TaxID=316456 RepID=UPI0034DD73F2
MALLSNLANGCEGLAFEVCTSLYEEDLDPYQFDNPADYVVETAFNKVNEVSTRLQAQPNQPDLIIGADTAVVLDGKIFGKPNNKETAFHMLEQLSGRSHTVVTGVVLQSKTKTVKFHESTKVFFAPLTSKIIKAYIDTGEPMDKAGGYGIQGLGGSLVEKIEGDYFNVMGLPLHHLCKEILQLYECLQ